MPQAALATCFVMLLPAALVTAVVLAGHPALLLVSVPLAVGLSVVASRVGAAIWKRRPRSRDLVFADLMLWGWLRRFRAERRLAGAHSVLGPAADEKGLSAEHRVEALTRLSGLLEARDAYTHGHSRRVTRHAERIARAMHLPATEVAQVRTAAALHDVGKIHTPREILNKPDRLTDEEFAVIKRHPGDGADMLAGIDDAAITAMVRHHHERLDGAGYPHGLAGEDGHHRFRSARRDGTRATEQRAQRGRRAARPSRRRPGLNLVAFCKCTAGHTTTSTSKTQPDRLPWHPCPIARSPIRTARSPMRSRISGSAGRCS